MGQGWSLPYQRNRVKDHSPYGGEAGNTISHPKNEHRSGNVAAVLGSLPAGRELDKIFYF